MGTVEVEDQIIGVRWLIEQGLADPRRVGIYGWSYGGYMALMCMAQAPDIFKAAVAEHQLLPGTDTTRTIQKGIWARPIQIPTVTKTEA